jgi:hypothetical protein
MLYSSQDHLRIGTHDFDHPVSCRCKKTDSWHSRKGDLQRAFPVDVPMVPSSVLTVAADGERLSGDVFSFGKTIHFGSLEFNVDRFSGLSLAPFRDSSGAAKMGSTHSGTPFPLWSMTEDSVKEFHMASDGEGRIDLPFP